jgi:hypothetical protein
MYRGCHCFFFLIVVVGLPGVLFVLPDSYVDPEYKDYGGESFSLEFEILMTMLLYFVSVIEYRMVCCACSFGVNV